MKGDQSPFCLIVTKYCRCITHFLKIFSFSEWFKFLLNISDMINPVIGANLCVNILFSGSMIPGWRSRRTSCMPRRPPTWISLERISSSTALTSGMSWGKCQSHRGQIQGHRVLTCILTNQEGQTACAAGGYRIRHNACARAAANHQGMRTDKEPLMPKRHSPIIVQTLINFEIHESAVQKNVAFRSSQFVNWISILVWEKLTAWRILPKPWPHRSSAWASVLASMLENGYVADT